MTMKCPVCGYGALARVRKIVRRPGHGVPRMAEDKYARNAGARGWRKLSRKTFLECESCGKVFEESEDME